MKNNLLVLVDGSSYLFRAYYALPPLSNSKGKPTGAIYGVLNMLRRLIADYEPSNIAVVFDTKGKNFRHELFSDYKANRAKMPDDLALQIEPLHEAIKAMGLPLITKPGVEADDVIATLTKEAQQKQIPVLISTGDKDLAQLVTKNVTLVNTMNNKKMDPAGVVEKFGVKPEQIIDYLALMGDTSDNIPGVPNVGPKTAAKWINEYGTLDNLIKHADEIKGKVGENLREHLTNLPLMKQLVTVKTDCDCDVAIESLKQEEYNREKLIGLFSELEFKNWLSELQSAVAHVAEAKPTQINYETILTQKDFDKWLKKLEQAKEFALDTETTSIYAMQAKLVGLSFSVKKGEAAYVPLAHDYETAPKQLSKETVLNALKPLLQDKNKTIVGQNLKYDIEILQGAYSSLRGACDEAIPIKNKMFDTLLASYVMHSTGERHDMDSMAITYLDHQTIRFEDIAGKGAKQLTFNQIELEKAAPYAAEDADITLQLKEKLNAQLHVEKCFVDVFNTIEMPLMPILAKMEMHGVLIDKNRLLKQSKILEKRIKELEEEAYKVAGEIFNMSSPKQLQEILFEKLSLPILKKTPGGQASTAEEVLQDLAHDYPLPKVILEYRSLTKLKSTYTDKLPEEINPKTGRVHTSYNQAVTSTGRLSSNHPNLQNIPVRTEQGRQIRQAFIAPKGFKIMAADYSQVELRIIADLSQDPGLLKAFKHNLDVHRATAAEVFGVELEDVTSEQRRSAKAINFGLLYGMSSFGLAKQLTISRDQAQRYMDRYFERYPNVHAYMEKTRRVAATQGYVSTLFGRRLAIPEINSKNIMRKKAAERAAINAPMQGTAADIIKRAMICIDDWLTKTNSNVKMIMQVHDELVFEVPENEIEATKKHVIHCMESAASLSVPLLVDVGVGDNWDEAH